MEGCELPGGSKSQEKAMDPVRISENLAFQLQLGLGALVILIHAYKRFATPTHYRATTTALRYNTSAALYCLMALFLYLALSYFPELAASLVGLLGGQDALPPDLQSRMVQAKALSPPLLAVIFMTVILPGTPIAKSVDEQLRRSFRRMALIPFEIRRLSQRLYRAPYQPCAEGRVQADEVVKGVKSRDGPTDVWNDSALAQWEKITSLMVGLREWKRNSTYWRFVEDYESQFEDLEIRYQRCKPIVQEYFDSIGEVRRATVQTSPRRSRATAGGSSSAAPGDDESDPFRKFYRRMLDAQCDDLLHQICDLIGRGILQSHHTEKGRREGIKALGFQMEITARTPLDQIVLIFLLLLLASFVLQIGFRLANGMGVQGPRFPVFAFAIPAVHCLAAVWAIYPKESWNASRRSADGIRPYSFYLTCACFSALTAVPIFFVMSVIRAESLDEAPAHFLARSLMILLPAGTTFFTAFNLDNPHGIKHLRAYEAVGQGLAQSALAIFVLQFMPWASKSPVKILGIPVLPVIMALVIGSIIGWLVPEMYRRRRIADLATAPDPAVGEPGRWDQANAGSPAQ
jgi:hypothetical protein